MSIFSRVVEDLQTKRDNRLNGKVNSIPFHNFPKLNKVIPGIQKERYIVCTASQKTGKTKITDALFLISPIEYIMANPDSGVKVKIFYFTLELSKEYKMMELLSYKIYKETGKAISPEMLQSVFESYILDEEILKLIEKYKEWFEKVEKIVTFVDNVRNAFGIFKTMRDYALANGKIHNKTISIDGKEREVEDYYEPYDKEEYVIGIIDTINLLHPENINGNKQTLYETIFNFSNNYALGLRDRFKQTIVVVAQQSSETDKEEFTFSGNSIIQKLKPSSSNISDCKSIKNDCNLMLGLFNPYRFGIKKYGNIDIEKYRDNYRELSILLNRNGISNATLDLYFRGDCSWFEEIDEDSNSFLLKKQKSAGV